MWQKILLLAAAGAAGTICRYLLADVVNHYAGKAFPWGTLAVNVLGCFLFGLVASLAEEQRIITEQSRVIVLTGFMGAFTTFSTFAYETTSLGRNGHWLAAGGNLLLENGLGIAAVLLGIAAARVVG
ncbi:MAG: fluoride efflux transporter CrcB [Pirellulales bacterium]